MEQISLDLVVTGSHLSSSFGNTETEILKDGFSAYGRVPIPLGNDGKEDMAKATGAALSIFADYFHQNRPEALLVLGDRYEILAAVIAAHMMGIPIAHISGGDITEGAVDNAIRHSITKMSVLHFPGCSHSARRIIQMGEDPSMVFNVGEPGVENCLKTQFMTRQELEESVGFSGVRGNYSVVTFHPETMGNNTEGEQVRSLIRAMDYFSDMSYIITLANADAGGHEINALWEAEGEKHKNWLVVPSLGVRRYLSAVKNSCMVIGNSSSGIVEAPALRVPTVNIGDRQKGREMAESVICCEPETEMICKAMEKALNPVFREKSREVHSPFGDGRTSEQIVSILIQKLDGGEMDLEKPFFDITPVGALNRDGFGRSTTN
jgi:GDP/UDP-N,N'-diacetylbacillosamine 2-epimerase (hydrolysing)